MAESELIPVYLFGPIGEGRANEPALQVIRDTIRENQGEVLTPHVADWETAISLRETLGWEGLYDLDAEGLRNAFLGIGEVSYPSTGSGREIERLLNFKRPVIAFRGIDKSYKSALIDGERNPSKRHYSAKGGHRERSEFWKDVDKIARLMGRAFSYSPTNQL